MTTSRDHLSTQDRERASVFHSWSAQSTLAPLMVERAEGVYVYAEDGTKFLDFSSQLVNTNIGHQHPAVVAADTGRHGRRTAARHDRALRGWDKAIVGISLALRSTLIVEVSRFSCTTAMP